MSSNPILSVTYPLSALLIFTLAIGLGFFLTRRFSLGWRLYWIGAVTFLLSQAGHIPFNLFLTRFFQIGALPSPPDRWLPAFNALVLGISAAVFEEFTRLIVLRLWVKAERGWKHALVFGAGHAGIEAILVGGIIFYSFLVMTTLQGKDLTTMVPQEQLPLLETQIEAYWTATWYDSLLGFVERSLTIPVHLSLAVLVMLTMAKKEVRWFLLAVIWHTLVDAGVVFIFGKWGAYAAEGLLAAFTAGSISMIYLLRERFPSDETDEISGIKTSAETIPEAHLPPIKETNETIQQTRYFDET